jgi:hypothetical protein
MKNAELCLALMRLFTMEKIPSTHEDFVPIIILLNDLSTLPTASLP